MVKDRSGDGQFTSEHTDAEILAAVRAHEPAATSEVAEEVGMTRQGVDRRLRRLRDDGRVSSKKIGASLVWFAPVAEKAREPAVTPSEDTPDQSDPSPEPTREPAHAPAEDGEELLPEQIDDEVRDAVEDAAAGWDRDDRLDARKAAARAVLQYALDTGEAVGKSHPVVAAAREAYPVEGQNDETYWRKNIRDAVLKSHGDYSKATQGYTVDELAGDL